MCGLTGFLSVAAMPRDRLEAVAKAMADQLVHRGPDDGGVWADIDCGLALAHRRLSIIDLSECGHQPMLSSDGRYVVAYNGELYNFRTLREELEGIGERFRGHSDTEVLVAAVSRWGVKAALERFNGMFAVALWDRTERVLHLARDRLGEKPLYYGWMGNTFLFGSELKALKVHPSWRGNVDRNALSLYLRHNYVPSPFSIYEGISKLPPGCTGTLTYSQGLRDRSLTVQPYWSVRDVAERGAADRYRGTAKQAVDELEDRLKEAVGLRMVADVPLGAFLSGGIDSSTVVALMQVQSTRPVRTFSIGFHEDEYNEADHAAAVAKHLGTDHTELYVTPDEAMAVIPSLPCLYDEPFGDSSQIPTFLVSKLAREQVTVSLSGDGGDELFGGYNRYFLGERIWRSIGWAPRVLRRTAARGVTAFSPAAWDSGFGAVKRALPARLRYANPGDKLHKLAEVLAVPAPEVMYLGLVSHWKQPNEIVIGGGEPATALTDQDQWARLGDFSERMMYMDSISYLPDDILVKVDRASMGVSLESRIPLLDHRLVEFAWRLPLSMKIRGSEGKWILRQVVYRHVPRELLERPKTGFGVPIDHWLRGPLRGWAEDLLSAERLRREGYLNPAPIREKWEEHLSGRRNWQYLLWDVLMFQGWLQEQTAH